MDTLDSNGRATADIDAEETRDWLDSLDSVVREDGAERARSWSSGWWSRRGAWAPRRP